MFNSKAKTNKLNKKPVSNYKKTANIKQLAKKNNKRSVLSILFAPFFWLSRQKLVVKGLVVVLLFASIGGTYMLLTRAETGYSYHVGPKVVANPGSEPRKYYGECGARATIANQGNSFQDLANWCKITNMAEQISGYFDSAGGGLTNPSLTQGRNAGAGFTVRDNPAYAKWLFDKAAYDKYLQEASAYYVACVNGTIPGYEGRPGTTGEYEGYLKCVIPPKVEPAPDTVTSPAPNPVTSPVASPAPNPSPSPAPPSQQGPAGYTFCANEGGSCNTGTTATVAYGANGKFAYKENVVGSIFCNNATFGDPAPYSLKACYYIASSDTRSRPPQEKNELTCNIKSVTPSISKGVNSVATFDVKNNADYDIDFTAMMLYIWEPKPTNQIGMTQIPYDSKKTVKIKAKSSGTVQLSILGVTNMRRWEYTKVKYYTPTAWHLSGNWVTSSHNGLDYNCYQYGKY